MGTESDKPQTLAAAHELLNSQHPGADAPLDVRVAYHTRSARIYRAVAEIDGAHRHEATFWADHEQRQADELNEHRASDRQQQ